MRAASWALLALLFAAPASASAQFWPDHDWWHSSPNLLENHPTAHLLGGGAVNVLARGPWITKTWRDTPLKRLAWCGVFQSAWEGFQVLEIKDYPAKVGAWDLGAALVGCAATEGVVALGRKLFR